MVELEAGLLIEGGVLAMMKSRWTLTISAAPPARFVYFVVKVSE